MRSWRGWMTLLGAALLVAPACGDDDGVTPIDAGTTGVADASPPAPDAGPINYRGPDDWCPGSAHCPGAGVDNHLQVGVARVSITPELIETDWVDSNGDQSWQSTEEFTDVNHNGVFDALWLVNGTGRVAHDVHDEVDVRALALRYDDTTVVIAYLDAYYLFIDQMDLIQAMPEVTALDVDHIIIGSTHDHSAIDTLGLSGSNPLSSGVDPDYMAFVRQRTADAIVAAVGDLRPANMVIKQLQTVDENGSTLDWVSDVREPVIYDPTVTVVRFVTADSDSPIATLINWASHPEYSWFDHNSVSADFVSYLRDKTEQGFPDEDLPGLGGVTVFVQGPLGGQIGPDAAHPIGADGQPISEHGFPQAEAGGTNVARLVLQAMDEPDEMVDTADAVVSYHTAEIYAVVENTALIALGLVGVLDRQFFFYDPDQPIDEDNPPWVRSRITYLQVGPVALITAPGELSPELWVGGYDGSWSWGQDIVSGALPNTPDLGDAPRPPYLRDLMLTNPGVRYAFVAGLAEDALGYVVASFNYVLDENNPYLEEAAGDHYEETLSLGPRCEEQLQHPMMEMATWRPPAESAP